MMPRHPADLAKGLQNGIAQLYTYCSTQYNMQYYIANQVNERVQIFIVYPGVLSFLKLEKMNVFKMARDQLMNFVLLQPYFINEKKLSHCS